MSEDFSRAPERQLRALFDHTFQFIGLLDREGRLLEANRTALEFAGYTREEAIGQRFWETRWWNSSGELMERIRSAIVKAARGEFVRFEAEHRGQDGRVIVVDFSLTPVRDEAGEVVFLIPEGRDITERKQLERVRDEYLAFISHDLRNPVGTIALHAELLRRSLGASGVEAESARIIAESAQRVESMIGELLEMTRLESKRPELCLRDARIDDLVAGVIERTMAPAARGRVRVVAKSAVDAFACDPDRVERVIGNLLTNAIKYSAEKSEIVVEIDGDAAEVAVAVRDRGPGIAPADQLRIFDKFERAHDGHRKESLGLGLYICRLIVEAHGGRIWVESVPGAGSTFRFALPRRAIVGTAPPIAMAPRKLLIVDDEANACRALATLLAEENFVVETATSGHEALSKLDDFEAEIALVDVSMPGMSGIDLVRHARERAPGLRCVFMTGLDRDDAPISDVDFITKPIDIDQLLRTLQRLA